MKNNQTKTILFLNENPLPPIFTNGTIAGKELRLRAAISQIDEVHVISRRGQSVINNNSNIGNLEKKIIIHLLPPWPYYFAGLPLFIWGIYFVLKLKPLTIEAESPIISGPAAVLLGKLFKIPSIIEVRASYEKIIEHRFKFIPYKWKKFVLNLVFWNTLKNANCVISNSLLYQNKLNKKGINSVVINPGIQFSNEKLSNKINDKSFIIGFLGRLVPEKGVDILLHAFELIIRELKTIQLKLEIAGDGPELIKLKTLVEELKIENQVKFLGVVDSSKILSSWKLLVNPNTVSHPLEMVNAEAAYMGVPVICFGKKYYPETVKHNVTGIKLMPKNAERLARGLKNLILDSKLIEKLSHSGRIFAKQNYSFQNQVKKLEDLYKDLKIKI